MPSTLVLQYVVKELKEQKGPDRVTPKVAVCFFNFMSSSNFFFFFYNESKMHLVLTRFLYLLRLISDDLAIYEQVNPCAES